MGKWLVGAYIAAMVIELIVRMTVSIGFALRTALLVFVGGAVIFTLFAWLCAKASMPRPAKDYLGKNGEVRMPFAVKLLTWTAFGVLIAGWVGIFAGVFLFRS